MKFILCTAILITGLAFTLLCAPALAMSEPSAKVGGHMMGAPFTPPDLVEVVTDGHPFDGVPAQVVTPIFDGVMSDGSLCSDSEADIEFAAGDDGAVIKKTPRGYFRDMLTAAKPLVEFSSEATGDTPNAQPGATSDPNVLARKAVEFQSAQAAAGVTISVTDAIKHVQASGE